MIRVPHCGEIRQSDQPPAVRCCATHTHTHTHTHTQVIGAVFNKLVASLAAYRPKQADTMVLGESDERSWAETWRELLRLLRQHSFRIGEVVAVSVLTSSVTFGLPWVGA